MPSSQAAMVSSSSFPEPWVKQDVQITFSRPSSAVLLAEQPPDLVEKGHNPTLHQFQCVQPCTLENTFSEKDHSLYKVALDLLLRMCQEGMQIY